MEGCVYIVFPFLLQDRQNTSKHSPPFIFLYCICLGYPCTFKLPYGPLYRMEWLYSISEKCAKYRKFLLSNYLINPYPKPNDYLLWVKGVPKIKKFPIFIPFIKPSLFQVVIILLRLFSTKRKREGDIIKHCLKPHIA